MNSHAQPMARVSQTNWYVMAKLIARAELMKVKNFAVKFDAHGIAFDVLMELALSNQKFVTALKIVLMPAMNFYQIVKRKKKMKTLDVRKQNTFIKN